MQILHSMNKKFLDYFFIIIGLIGAFAYLLPFFWVLSLSFRAESEAFLLPIELFPKSFDFNNYKSVFESKVNIERLFYNSLKISVLVTLGQLVTCTLAGYGLARSQHKFSKPVFYIMLAGMMIPAQATIVPLFLGIAKIGLFDTHASIIIPLLTSSFGIFLIRQFVLTQPIELEEAAIIDGAGPIRTFVHVSLPQLGPVLSAFCILTFISSWNMYFQPLIFLESWDKMTLPIGLQTLKGFISPGSNVSVIMAALSMIVIPTLVLFIFLQKYIIKGLTFSGIKG